MCLAFHIMKTLTDYRSLVRKLYRNLNDNVFLFCRHELLLYFFTISERTFVYILLQSDQRKRKFPPAVCLATISFLRGIPHSQSILAHCTCVQESMPCGQLGIAGVRRKLQRAVIILFLTRVL